jgi:hypothetical protein
MVISVFATKATVWSAWGPITVSSISTSPECGRFISDSGQGKLLTFSIQLVVRTDCPSVGISPKRFQSGLSTSSALLPPFLGGHLYLEHTQYAGHPSGSWLPNKKQDVRLRCHMAPKRISREKPSHSPTVSFTHGISLSMVLRVPLAYVCTETDRTAHRNNSRANILSQHDWRPELMTRMVRMSVIWACSSLAGILAGEASAQTLQQGSSAAITFYADHAQRAPLGSEPVGVH